MALTEGILSQVYKADSFTNDKRDSNLQIISVTQETNKVSVIVSDGQFSMRAILGSSLRALVTDGTLAKDAVIKIRQANVNTVNGIKLLIITDLAVVENPGFAIGTPTDVSTVMEKASPMETSPFLPQKTVAKTSRHQNKENFWPINSLNPYQNNWTIKARVTKKHDIREWSNARGNGKLFSVDLLDKSGGQVKATMFNAEADKLYPVFQENSVFIISRGRLRIANKKFNSLPNQYEITLNESSEVSPVEEDESIGTQKFTFVSIDQLPKLQANDYIDFIGVVKSASPIQTLTSNRTGKELTKRSIQVVDKSLLSVDCTVWGQHALKFHEDELVDKVVVIKAARVSEFGGRSLGTTFGGDFYLEPENTKEVQDLKQWYENKGRNAQVESISAERNGGRTDARKLCNEITPESLEFDKPEYYLIRGTITYLGYNKEKTPWYPACPSDTCNKKVTSDQAGGWMCDKCNKSYPTCTPRYIMSMMVSDGSGFTWLSAFNEIAEKILHKKASELAMYAEQGNDAAIEKVFKDATFDSYLLKVRAKAEMSQSGDGEKRVRATILGMQKLNFVKEGNHLLEEIMKMC